MSELETRYLTRIENERKRNLANRERRAAKGDRPIAFYLPADYFQRLERIQSQAGTASRRATVQHLIDRYPDFDDAA